MHQGRPGGRAALTQRARRAITLYAVVGSIYGLDRLSKVLAEAHLEGRPPIEIIPGVFQLRFTTNPGGAFGLFGGLTWLFVAVSLLVVAVAIISSFDLPSWPSAVGLGLIVGGAVGNLTDRFIRGDGFSGEVVDFFDFHVWPVFNVADSAIVIGAAIVAIAGLRREGRERRSS